MKKQKNQVVRMHVQQVDMLKSAKGGKVAGWICSCVILWLLLLTTVLFFIDIFPLQKVMEWGKLLGGLFVIAVWVTITYTHKRTMMIMLPMAWIFIGFFIARRWAWLWLCIQNLVDAVIIQVNQYHWTRYMLWNSAKVPSAEIMLVCMAPISLWSGYYVVRRPMA
ncbi:MAG: hypothetical protein IJ315_04635, partial [Firmicutes bacterium]|nr:hypothetical protein [Bacillota bacterium]